MGQNERGPMDLAAAAVESSDVLDCSVGNATGEECPCLNEGTCVSTQPTKCSCVNGYR